MSLEEVFLIFKVPRLVLITLTFDTFLYALGGNIHQLI